MQMAIPLKYNFGESLHHMRRALSESMTRRALPYRVSKYIDALVGCMWKEQYALVSFDVLICGPDRLLNAILAYRAASEGLTVGIYHGKEYSWENYEQVSSTRAGYYHQSFAGLLERRFDMKKLGSDLHEVTENLCFHLDQLVDDDLNPLVVQIDSCKLLLDDHGDHSKIRLWVDPDTERHVYPAIERLIFWPDTTAQRFQQQSDMDAKFAITAKKVWLTARPTKELYNMNRYCNGLFGDASRPLSGLEFMKGNDRLEDLSEVTGHSF